MSIRRHLRQAGKYSHWASPPADCPDRSSSDTVEGSLIFHAKMEKNGSSGAMHCNKSLCSESPCPFKGAHILSQKPQTEVLPSQFGAAKSKAPKARWAEIWAKTNCAIQYRPCVITVLQCSDHRGISIPGCGIP
eukprot:425515-Rhodomonas_salina.1